MIMTPWPRLCRGFATLVGSLTIALGLAACSQFFEPPMNAQLVAQLSAIETGTTALEDSFTDPAANRVPLYESLDSQAADAIGVAHARQATRRATAPEGRYGVATVGFLSDFRETLADLAARDRAWGEETPPQPIVRLRLAALRDALDDALYYETVVLDRRYAPPARGEQ